MSIRPLGDSEYDDGEVYPITLTTPIGLALINDRWLNFSEERQAYWLSELSSPRIRFAGTVISRVRRQVELTIIYADQRGASGRQVSFCITLPDFDRFLVNE